MNPAFSNFQCFKTPANSNQKSFPFFSQTQRVFPIPWTRQYKTQHELPLVEWRNWPEQRRQRTTRLSKIPPLFLPATITTVKNRWTVKTTICRYSTNRGKFSSPVSRTNFRFTWGFRKSGFLCTRASDFSRFCGNFLTWHWTAEHGLFQALGLSRASARGGTWYILEWGGAARPLKPWIVWFLIPCLRGDFTWMLFFRR